MTSNVPEIRFEGYEGEWEKSSFSETFDRVRSYPLSRDMETEEDSGVKYIHYGDIHVGKANKVTEVSRIPNIRTGKYEYLNKGDIVLADASEDYQGIAKPSVIVSTTSFNIVAGLHTIALRPKKDNSLFVYYLLFAPTFRRYGYKTGTGMKVFGISITNILKFETSFPDLQEQQAIGSFFKELDDRITLQQTSLESLKETKQGFLQKMFPKKGEATPEIRFEGFEGEWEEVKLGERGLLKSGIGFPESEQGGIGDVPFYKISDMNLNGNEYEMIVANNYVSYEQLRKNKWMPISDNAALIFAKVGAAIMLNRKRLVRHSFLMDNNTMAYILGSDWDVHFCKIIFDTINLAKFAQVGALPSYNSSDISNIKINVPYLSEQQAIGSFFKELDDSIALEERELELLKETKKAFLQKMFI